MGLFSGLKKMFDAGGIKLALEAPKTFDWEGGGIPVTVTITGGEEPRTVTALEFELEDEPESDGPVGSRDSNRSRTTISSRNRFSMSFTHDGPFDIGAKEVKTFALTVPVQAQHNPGSGVADAVIGAVLGGTVKFGAAWYKLSVGAPVEGAKITKSTSKRIKASGQMKVSGGAGW